jgi:hypothetical protein
MSKRRKIHQTVFQDWETGVPKTSTTSGAYRSFKCSSPLFSVYIDLGLFLREKRMDINLQYKELSEIGSFFSLLFMNVNKSQNVIGRCFITSHLFPSSSLLSSSVSFLDSQVSASLEIFPCVTCSLSFFTARDKT